MERRTDERLETPGRIEAGFRQCSRGPRLTWQRELTSAGQARSGSSPLPRPLPSRHAADGRSPSARAQPARPSSPTPSGRAGAGARSSSFFGPRRRPVGCSFVQLGAVAPLSWPALLLGKSLPSFIFPEIEALTDPPPDMPGREGGLNSYGLRRRRSTPTVGLRAASSTSSRLSWDCAPMPLQDASTSTRRCRHGSMTDAGAKWTRLTAGPPPKAPWARQQRQQKISLDLVGGIPGRVPGCARPLAGVLERPAAPPPRW